MKHQIPKYKLEIVKELANLLKNNKTVLVASIKNIPASQYQAIGKKIRDKAKIKVPKKSLIFRAIDSIDEGNIKELKNYIDEGFAILFSDIDGYELAGELLRSKTPAKAKVGQEAPEDIEIPEGPTELMPGPAISELGALGIQVQIEKGKIHIKAPKIIAKKGEKISAGAADIMGKLDIKPFSIGLTPLVIYDKDKKKIYTNIKINTEETINEIKVAFSKALGFAVGIGQVNNDTIKILLSKANAHYIKLNRIMTGEPEPIVEQAPQEENKPKEPAEEKPKEEKKEAAAEGLSALFG